jgi:hypothetical protein
VENATSCCEQAHTVQRRNYAAYMEPQADRPQSGVRTSSIQSVRCISSQSAVCISDSCLVWKLVFLVIPRHDALYGIRCFLVCKGTHSHGEI